MRIPPGAASAPTPLLLPVIGAVMLLALSAWSLPTAQAQDSSQPSLQPVKQPSFAQLRARLDRGDQIAALHALQMALNQTADGGTFLWQRHKRDLKGIIRPTAAFRNASGRVCRHVIYALSLGGYRKQIELVACREAGGRWRL